jgi:NADPH2:quinone reductase
MRAAIYEKTGAARDVISIVDMETPQAGPGEVRVQLHTSGVNPSDVKSRSGARVIRFPRVIPHSDGAGVIDQVGESVDLARLGQRVWTWNAAWNRPNGTAAEFVVLPASQVVRLPDSVDMLTGACLGIPAMTALHTLLVCGGVSGQRVLVPGGAGAVGHYAIQMARLLGAHQVLTTVSGGHKALLAKQAGADVVINYRNEDVCERVMSETNGYGVDRIVEVNFAANIETSLKVMKPDSLIVTYGSNADDIKAPFYSLALKNVGLQFFILYNLDNASRQSATIELTNMLEKGLLQHNIASIFTLEETAAAHEWVEQDKGAGNVVIKTSVANL